MHVRDGWDFNMEASMLEMSRMEFEVVDEQGVRIIVFIPTDEAFAKILVMERLQSLPAEQRVVVL